MCYSSNRDFGWNTKKDATSNPEGRRETMPRETMPKDRAETPVEAEDFKFWAFLGRRREPKAHEPIVELTREKV